MNPTDLLLNTYYETLYELLNSNIESLRQSTEELLLAEIQNHNLGPFDDEKLAAYRDVAFAFLTERIETYNPVGIQYTFDRPTSKLARQLELQLDWYDSTEEFDLLRQAAVQKAAPDMTDAELCDLADELIDQCGAFPNRSIIAAYQSTPALNKLPDYTLAIAIEKLITS